MKRSDLSPFLLLPVFLLAFAPGSASAQEVEVLEPNRGGEIDLSASDPAVALSRLHTADGYEVSLFASERDFPIGNPVALAWDARGRLWVSTMPTYPHYQPGDPPTDKLIILEDTDGDGRADKHTIFADSLYLAAGFELGHGGVYISQQPDLVFLKDTDGDDVADERRIVLHGFGTEDSHHAIHAFTWGPDGALYFQEGTFLHSQVETPFGPVRLENAGVWRYEPLTERLSVLTSYSYSNPWGHVFDGWGQDFIADASSGNNFFALPISGHVDYPRKHPQMRVFTPVVRPTAGAEIISSRHFPDDAQGNFLVPNVIGFQGIKNYEVIFEGSGVTSREVDPLIYSTDINFRPIDMEFAPDGSLYMVDWFNPLIGHMQYSLRDPRRDNTHGRIWRITYPDRALLPTTNLEELSTADLLDQLKVYEDRVRYRARRELAERDTAEVARELAAWISRLDPADEQYEHNLLEALWSQQRRDRVDPSLLERLLRANDHRARAAATRVLRYSLHRVSDPIALLRRQVNDEHPLVRLEGVVALSFVSDARAAEAALDALRHPMDYYLDYGLKETIAGLERYWSPILLGGQPFATDNPEGVLFLIDGLDPAEVSKVLRTEEVNGVLVRRGGVPMEVRREALRALSVQRQTAAVSLLLDAMTIVDGEDGSGSGAADLAALMSEIPTAELAPLRVRIEQLATGARNEYLRRAAYPALMRIDGGTDRAWALAEAAPGRMLDLLAGIPALDDPALNASLLPRIRGLATTGPGATVSASTVRGRYVRLEQPGCCETQSFAEVEVMDGSANVALGGSAQQKSTASGGEARRAVDGNTAGSFRLGSVSQSAVLEADPWWEVDLGEERTINAVRVWQRSDNDIDVDLDRFTLRILDARRNEVVARENLRGTEQPATIVVADAATDAAAVRREAVRALVAMEGSGAERLPIFAELLRRGVDRDLAVAGIDTVLATGGNVSDPAALAAEILRFARDIPTADRAGPTFTRAAALGDRLASMLPAAEGARVATAFDILLPKLLQIRALEGAMRFDINDFSVEAGREVEIVFQNPDIMPHNLVVTQPGSVETVGRAADAMASQADAYEKDFVPDLPAVLFATRLINPGERVTLSFQAPSEPGEYPFICTFPGHWLSMKGVMRVTEVAR